MKYSVKRIGRLEVEGAFVSKQWWKDMLTPSFGLRWDIYEGVVNAIPNNHLD